MKVRTWLLGQLFFVSAIGQALEIHAMASPVVTRLPNGLTVVLQEDHSAPVVAIQYWVGAGSRTETDKEAGITHLIEHMIFKGTPTRGAGELAWAVESSGGSINAYTTYDYTVYHVTIPSRLAKAGLEVLTDSIQNPSFPPEELEQEKRVVLEELRMREDRPEVLLQKALFKEAFRVHPYGRPIIGYPHTVSSLSREDLLRYVGRLYTPGNISLIIVGDLDAQDALGWIREMWENKEPREAKLPEVPQEPVQEGLRSVVFTNRSSEAQIALAFAIPAASHPDIPALDLLAAILGEGESSRLDRSVRVGKGLVHSIGAYSYTLLDRGLFWVSARLQPGNLEQALEAIFQETRLLQSQKVTSQELNKARLQVEASLVRTRETMEGKARALGQFLMLIGDIDGERAYLEAIGRVTPEDLQRVAKEYLRGERLTAGVLLPDGSPQILTEAELEQMALVRGRLTQEQSQGEVPSSHGSIHKEVLPNGLTLLVKESHEVPTVAMRMVFLGGSRFETKEKEGLSRVVAHMLTRGTQTRSAQEMAREVESLAGSLEGFSGRNTIGIQADFLSRFFPQAMELLSDALLNCTFPEQELERERPRLLASIRRERDQPTRLAMRRFTQTLFKVHPYGFRLEGSEESLSSMGRQDLVDFAAKVLVPSNAVLSIVGDVSVAEARKWTLRYLGGWRSGEFSPPEIPLEPPLEAPREVRDVEPLQQVHLLLGFPGTTLDSPDRFALEVLDTVLSGQGGRLFRELRDRQGLAYSVTSFSQVGLDPGFFATYIATSPENLERALESLRHQLELVAKQPVSPQELKRAKEHIVGSYEIGHQTHASQAMTMALDERYGLGHDYGKKYIEAIRGVTAEQVLDVAARYLRMDRSVVTVLGPSP